MRGELKGREKRRGMNEGEVMTHKVNEGRIKEWMSISKKDQGAKA